MTPLEANRITVERLIDYRKQREAELGISLESAADLAMMKNRRHQKSYRFRKKREVET